MGYLTTITLLCRHLSTVPLVERDRRGAAGLSVAGTSDGLCCRLAAACARVKPTMYDMSHSTRDHWEIDRRSVIMQRLLGEGAYGQVWQGTTLYRPPARLDRAGFKGGGQTGQLPRGLHN